VIFVLVPNSPAMDPRATIGISINAFMHVGLMRRENFGDMGRARVGSVLDSPITTMLKSVAIIIRAGRVARIRLPVTPSLLQMHLHRV
jgi:hypothetical protein